MELMHMKSDCGFFSCYGRARGSGDRIGCAAGLVNGNTDARVVGLGGN